MTQPSGGFSMPASNNIPTPKQHMQQQQPQHANILQVMFCVFFKLNVFVNLLK